jgi:hypothetical protein
MKNISINSFSKWQSFKIISNINAISFSIFSKFSFKSKSIKKRTSWVLYKVIKPYKGRKKS